MRYRGKSPQFEETLFIGYVAVRKAGDDLAQETIDKVREAEYQAEELEQQSRVQANKIMDDAQGQAQEISRREREQAQARREKSLRLAEEQAQRLLHEAREATAKEATALKAEAQQKKQETLRMILQKVL